LVSAFIGDPHAGPGRLVEAWRDRRFTLIVSPMLLGELGEVLARPKFARWAGDGRGTAYVAGFGARSEHHTDPTQPLPSRVRDPDDDYLVALMHASQADVLVSLDRDLLDAQLDTITVLNPAEFVGRLPSAGTEELLLGRYRTLEQLGSGGFGVVWRAHDELLHREVAVKRIWLGPDGESERATREVHATARLVHPAIVALYEACAQEGAFYLISELVDGETLAQLIAADELEDEEVLEIGLALASALQHAHARGVIHRDIKPQNVLVPYQPQNDAPASQTLLTAAKLTDFGGASLVGEEALTRTGDVLGTLAYMAPEQSEGKEVGPQADLYSLALVIYEALCGVNPVRGATPAATVRRIGRPLPPLTRARRDLPPKLTRSLDRALAPKPRDRGTLEELRRTLEDTLAHDPKHAQQYRLTLISRLIARARRRA
jgi:putative PIN family toxin of toxin-antitoxin system